MCLTALGRNTALTTSSTPIVDSVAPLRFGVPHSALEQQLHIARRQRGIEYCTCQCGRRVVLQAGSLRKLAGGGKKNVNRSLFARGLPVRASTTHVCRRAVCTFIARNKTAEARRAAAARVATKGAIIEHCQRSILRIAARAKLDRAHHQGAPAQRVVVARLAYVDSK